MLRIAQSTKFALLTPHQIGSASHLNSVIFKDYSQATLGRKFFSLFPGLGYAAGYKVCHYNWF